MPFNGRCNRGFVCSGLPKCVFTIDNDLADDGCANATERITNDVYIQGSPKTRDILGLDNGYVWGQSDYQAYPFEQNRLTNCKVRYRVFREMMADYPHNQLGGISFMWLLQAIYAMRALRAQAANIVLPTLVFQAEQEHIVDNQKVTQFVKSLPAATFVTVAKAQHELLFEKDEVRESVVRQIFDFLNTSSVSKH